MPERFSELDDLVPDVLLDVPECPDRMAEHSLRHVLAAFLRKTKAWQEQVAGDLVADSAEVQLDLSEILGMVELVYSLKLNDSLVPPTHYYCSIDGLVTLNDLYVPSAAAVDGAVAKIAVVTDYHSSICPVAIFREAGHILIALAQAHLMQSVGKPYSNPQYAMMKQDYASGQIVAYMNKLEGRRTIHHRGMSA